MTAKIYIIFSHKGPKVYIGSTTQKHISTRIASHRNNYRKNTFRCSSADLFDEYGINDFSYKLLEECTIEDRFIREQYWIDFHPTSVNIQRKIRTVEYVRQRNSIAHQKRMENPEYGVKLREYQKKLRKNIIPKLCECGSIIRVNWHGHKTTRQHTQYFELGPFMHL